MRLFSVLPAACYLCGVYNLLLRAPQRPTLTPSLPLSTWPSQRAGHPAPTLPLRRAPLHWPDAAPVLRRGSLSNYNQELVACIEDLREKREELNRSLLRDEEEKSKIQKELSTLTERLSRLNEDLAR